MEAEGHDDAADTDCDLDEIDDYDDSSMCMFTPLK